MYVHLLEAKKYRYLLKLVQCTMLHSAISIPAMLISFYLQIEVWAFAADPETKDMDANGYSSLHSRRRVFYF